MAAIESYADFYQLDLKAFNQLERITIESILHDHLCSALMHELKTHHETYYKLIRLNPYQEVCMIESQFIRFIIQEIINSGHYSLTGIAYYTNTPEEIINELAIGTLTNPSFQLTHKILALHRSVKPDLYHYLWEKILHLTEVPPNKIALGGT